MAKKKSQRVTTSKAANTTNVSTVHSKTSLPPYQRILKAEQFYLFFENRTPEDDQHIKTNHCSVKRSFKIVSDGKELVGEEFAKTFARLVIKQYPAIKSKIVKISKMIERLFVFVSNSDDIKKIEDISFYHIKKHLNELQIKSVSGEKSSLRILFDAHPHLKSLKIELINVGTGRERLETLTREVTVEDIDDFSEEHKDYSDKVLFQLLASSYYELELWQERYTHMMSLTQEALGGDYIERPKMACKTTYRLLTSGEIGHQKLFENLLYYNKKVRLSEYIEKYTQDNFRNHLNKAVLGQQYEGKGTEYYYKFKAFLQQKMWSALNSKSDNFNKFFKLESQHWQVVLVLYFMLNTGVNREVALSIRMRYKKNNTPWSENYSDLLRNNSPNERQIEVVGRKNKTSIDIPIIISISSPLFKYMQFYDEAIGDPNREFFFDISTDMLRNRLVDFCQYFAITDDNNEPLTSIETMRIRKSFIGSETVRLLEGVNTPDELIYLLKNAANHKDFDTTWFSYISHTGRGTTAINAAIVALQSKMIDSALNFKGKIKSDEERDTGKNLAVYLCDCTDNTDPTHDYPIAGRCHKYDMCLGCERSEVYAEHIRLICYRVMQYDQFAKNNSQFKTLVEDRRLIALDALECFRNQHMNGELIYDNGYQSATDAIRNGEQLLPDIIQLN
ncbi:hypothetical protein [Pseudoalteromonas denitrificans]|uniref:Uncharacterized protein n=1 Tax=Pseudoalteromonas denitrificans DSM 6059 TaxID=1123010 RepID=A0A1I1PSW6_9GAMM|nr:hypothetical protein [Pseudoalteromonas denitrificans]SFD10063.1 hypothetical protein SAMN02745724_03490 [Pseudoalteromonas denitrificans DSM 6059]